MAAGPEGAEGVVIRPAEEGDLPELLAIYNHEVANGTATYDLEPATLAERAAWMAAHDTGEAALTGTHPLVVAALPEDGRPGGRAAGYASLSPYRGKGGYAATVELSVYVHQDMRGRGIGTLLMRHVICLARANEGIHVVLSVVDSANAGSIRLHERLGFVEVVRVREGARKFGRWLDDVTLELVV